MKNKPLIVIFLIVFIDLLGFGILIPILPVYATKQFHASEFEIGMMISIFSLCQFISNPILGKLSDRYGRKIILSISLLLASISYIIFAFAPSFWVAFISRAIAGIGGGSIGTAQAYVSDVTTENERAKGMGLVGAAFGLGFVFGPVIGGFLGHISFRTPNIAAGIFSFIAFILTLSILKETVIKTVHKGSILDALSFKNYMIVFVNKKLGTLVLIFFLLTFGIANTYGSLPLFGLKILKFSESQIGNIYGVVGLVSIFIQGYFLKKLSKKFSDSILLSTGIIIMSLGLFSIPFVKNYLFAILTMGFMTVGSSIITPLILSIISKSADKDRQGVVLGVNQSMGSLGRVFGPLWGGFTYEKFGYFIPFLTAGVFTLFTYFIKKTNLKDI